jgi:DNA replication protein DnaC
MYQLPPVPAHIGYLTDEQSGRLSQTEPLSYGCLTCDGDKQFRWWADAFDPNQPHEVVDYACDCPGQFVLDRYLSYHGLKRKYANFGWADVLDVNPDAHKAVLDYLANFRGYCRQGTGLLLHGPSGNGKSMLASLVLRYAISTGQRGFWTTFDQMLDLYTTGWRDNAERAWFDKMVRYAPVLVMDDLGKEHAARYETARASLDSVFRTRVQAGLVTMLTTNAERERFKETYKGAILSLSDEACLEVRLTTDDWRGRKFSLDQQEVRDGLTRPITLGGPAR